MTSFNRRDFARLIGLGVATAAVAPRVMAQSSGVADLVRLSSNENPYGPSPSALAAIRDSLGEASRYPDSQEDRLADALAALHSVSADGILLTNGSTEALMLAAAAFTGPDAPAVVAKPTFEAMASHARTAGASIVEVPLTSDYRHDLERMSKTTAGLVYICNPNNPTASITPKDQVRAFLNAVPKNTVVVIDEAYHHYVDSPNYESAEGFARTLPNVVVLRTFSKIYGMAGLRCGYALGARSTLAKMRRARGWNVLNLPAVVAAEASLRDREFVAETRRRNAETRARTILHLRDLGFATIPSHANFIMVDVRQDVASVVGALRDRGVEVGRRFPALSHHLRVTIGTASEMKRFVDALAEVTATRTLAA